MKVLPGKPATVEQRHLDAGKGTELPLSQQSQPAEPGQNSLQPDRRYLQRHLSAGELTPRSRRIASYGEVFVSQIIAARFRADGWTCCGKIPRTGNDGFHFTAAEVDFATTNEKDPQFLRRPVAAPVYPPGFIAADRNGTTTTLGRGGSDIPPPFRRSAAGSQSRNLDGRQRDDDRRPRMTNNARIIPQISYQEAMELSHFGAKVILSADDTAGDAERDPRLDQKTPLPRLTKAPD